MPAATKPTRLTLAATVDVFLPYGSRLYRSTIVSVARGVATDARGYHWHVATGLGVGMASLTARAV